MPTIITILFQRAITKSPVTSIFGGNDGSLDDETWVYDLSDNTWTLKSPATKPLARQFHAMASLGGDQVLLFGGHDGSSSDDETWVYPAPVTVTVTTSPAGLGISVDGMPYTSPQTFEWVVGSNHTIATTSPQSLMAGTQYVFLNWSDAGALSHSVTAPASPTTYTATFKTQHQLTTSASAGGTISPTSGFYDAGNILITATANTGFTFTGFSGALTGTTNPQTLNLTGPASVTANFAPANLALNKTATASSSKPGHPPGLAVDGSTGTHWRSNTLSSGTNAWLRVDLGATSTIGSVVIDWSGSFFAKKYTVQTSLTGAGGSWTTVYTDNTGNGGIDNITFVPQSGTRYVRVFMTQHNETVERINELEVYAASGSLSKESEVAKSEVSNQLSVISYQLEQNYPNPFNPTTQISYSVPSAAPVSLKIFNLAGQEVATLVNEMREAGRYTVTFDASRLTSGVYFAVLQADGVRQVRRLVLMK